LAYKAQRPTAVEEPALSDVEGIYKPIGPTDA